MRRLTLTELADNPDFISGIYNYCDRWCERCQFSSRCLLYAQEKEDADDRPETRDINNEAFWLKLSSIFQETRAMVEEWAKEMGVDLTEIDEEAEKVREGRVERAWRNRLATAGKDYAGAVTDWFAEFDQTITSSDLAPDEAEAERTQQLDDARDVIYWYQYQIAVKTMRALSSHSEEAEDPDEYTDPFRRDSDGSAKVALIGIDRSISGWRIMQLCVPERADSIIPLILQLEKLRHRTEKRFPQARSFIRPGFDEILGEAN